MAKTSKFLLVKICSMGLNYSISLINNTTNSSDYTASDDTAVKKPERHEMKWLWPNLNYEGRTESHEQLFLHANWEQQTKESAVVDGTSCCVILECLVTSIACIT